MKNFTYSIGFILMFSFIRLSAQFDFKPFLVKEGYSIAAKKASDLGYTNPKLIIIGSTTGDYQVSSFKINLKFELETGKATLWAYMFISSSKPDSMKAIAIISSPFPQGDKFLAVEITPEQLKSFPIPGNSPIMTDGWIDTGEMMNLLNKDLNFITFKSSCSSMRLKMIGLGIYSDKPLPDKTRPYWGAMFGNDQIENYFFVDAINGNVIDSKTLDVDDDITTNSRVMAFPNPANDIVSISFKLSNQSDISINLFNQDGRIVSKSNYTFSLSNNEVNLNIRSLMTGVYAYSIMNTNELVRGRFIVIK